MSHAPKELLVHKDFSFQVLNFSVFIGYQGSLWTCARTVVGGLYTSNGKEKKSVVVLGQ